MTPNPMEDGARNVLIQLLDKYDGDSSKTLKDFLDKSTNKMSEGNAPNEAYNLVSNMLFQLIPLQDQVDALDTGKRISKNDAFNALINDNVRKMNALVGEDIYEEVEDKFTGDRTEELKQSLIQLESRLPHAGDKERMEILWLIPYINEFIMGGVDG